MSNDKTHKHLFFVISQLSKKTYAQLTLLLCLIVTIGTAWMYRARYLDYQYYQYQVSHESTKAVGPQITEFVKETTRLVQLYTNKHLSELEHLIDNPGNDNLRTSIEQDLRLYFPKMLTFTLADGNGEPYWEDFDGLIGDLCQSELQSFARGQASKPTVHPIHNGYHFDVMTRFSYRDKTHILFVSFLAKMLGSVLNTAASPDHEIMLVAPQKNDLIEIVAGGARDIIKDRSDFRLSRQEKERILTRVAVADTQWEVVDLIAAGLLKNYQNTLVIEALSIIVLFYVTGFTLVFHLWRSDNKRALAEQQRILAQRQKDTMLAMVTHEFRTPLTAIHGALDLLHYSMNKNDLRSLELQQIAARNTHRLQVLVNDFLDLKQLESSEFTLKLAIEDLVKLIEESITANSTYAGQFHVTVRFERPTSPVWILADNDRISQVIGNLLSNAIKYGGENKTVEVNLIKTNEMARVEIRDHGDGIPHELQANLFKTFSTLHLNKNQSKVKSSGLGLSIVKNIIEKHNGHINLRSEPGQGTTFYFEIPLANADHRLNSDNQQPAGSDLDADSGENFRKKSA